jgi:transposase
MCRRPEQKGQDGRALAWRLHHENPRKIGRLRRHHRLRPDWRRSAFFARTLYKARARIEQGRGRIKRFKRVALRCEETKRNFKSIVSFAAGLCLIKFVHTP